MRASLRQYRCARGLTQVKLARLLGVTQAYISQLEATRRPISRRLAERLAALPDLPPVVLPPQPARGTDTRADALLGADLAALGYPGFDRRTDRGVRNPAEVILSIIARRQVSPGVMAAVPWVLLTYPTLDRAWLVEQVRVRNLQNRLGFLTDLALELAAGRRDAGGRPSRETTERQTKTSAETHSAAAPPAGPAAKSTEHASSDASRTSGTDSGDSNDHDDVIAALEALRADLESSRLANVGTLARVLTPTEEQFFQEHRSAAARHWNLLTGLTVAQLPYR